jgi:telomerase reverse transcriptase
VGRVVGFLWVGLVLPLLRTHFYVTETEATRNRLVYYRKPDWHRVTSAVIPTLVTARGKKNKTAQKKNNAAPLAASAAGVETHGCGSAGVGCVGDGEVEGVYRKLSKAEAKKLMSAREFAAPKMRLVPKRGVRLARPIVNMGSSKKKKTANAALGKAFAVLTGTKRASPEVMGASVGSLGVDMLVRFLPLVHLWKALRKQEGEMKGGSAGGRMYMASMDVVKSFDSIKHPKLMAVVDGLLGNLHLLMLQLKQENYLCCNRSTGGVLPPLQHVLHRLLIYTYAYIYTYIYIYIYIYICV